MLSSNIHALVLFFSAALFSLSTPSLAEANKSLSGFSIDLIHRDSPLSPFYNSSMTQSEILRNAALRSISRAISHSKSLDLSLDENDSADSILIPTGGDYLMKIYVGTPPLERIAVADTGSDLIWLQCSPCYKCFHQIDPEYFEPRKSSTFMGVSCDSKQCTLLSQSQKTCANLRKCAYSYRYGDTSFTNGELGIDFINLGSFSGGQAVSLPQFVFGCGHNNIGTFANEGKATGLVGLGAGPLSLVSQLDAKIGHKFSYCLLPFSSKSTSKLKFGNQAAISGNGVVSTPLITKSPYPAYYFLNLEGITVEGKTVRTGQRGGNIVIDTGATLTFLEPGFYKQFLTLMKGALGSKAVQSPPSPYDFCFENSQGTVFPRAVFHFTGADVTLAPKNLFFNVGKRFGSLICLAVAPSKMDVSIFGNVAQIDFQVEYDLERKTVSFAPTDCTKNN